MQHLKRHLTCANFMSFLAVFLLLGGATALAAKKQTQKLGTTQLKASAVTTIKIKNGAVANSKLAAAAVSTDKLVDGAVTNAKLADGAVSTTKLAGDAVTGDKVNEATLSEVPSANSANPPVFAKVNANGTVPGNLAKGLTSVNVVKPPLEFGVYCITAPSFSPRGGQVTPEVVNPAKSVAATLAIAGGPSCPAPAVEVETFVNGAQADAAFYVQFYR